MVTSSALMGVALALVRLGSDVYGNNELMGSTNWSTRFPLA